MKVASKVRTEKPLKWMPNTEAFVQQSMDLNGVHEYNSWPDAHENHCIFIRVAWTLPRMKLFKSICTQYTMEYIEFGNWESWSICCCRPSAKCGRISKAVASMISKHNNVTDRILQCKAVAWSLRNSWQWSTSSWDPALVDVELENLMIYEGNSNPVLSNSLALLGAINVHSFTWRCISNIFQSPTTCLHVWARDINCLIHITKSRATFFNSKLIWISIKDVQVQPRYATAPVIRGIQLDFLSNKFAVRCPLKAHSINRSPGASCS